MRAIKFRLVKDGQLQGEVELKSGGIIDVAYAWDTAYQFTGLHDKNNKKIWEKDLVLCCDNKKYLVVWDNNKIGYVLTQEGLIADEGLWIRDWFFNEIEVIGNIYKEVA